MNQTVEPTDLIISLPTSITAESFTDNKQFEEIFSKIEDVVKGHVPDLSTKAGREQIASIAYKVARTKTTLVKEGKKLTEGWRNQTKLVNEACNKIEERLDRLRDQARRPLTEWEIAEEARVTGLKEKLAALIALSKTLPGKSSAELSDLLSESEGTPMGANYWDEFEPQARIAQQDAVAALTALRHAALKQEAEAEELKRLRAEKEERDRADAARLAAEEAKRAEEARAAQEKRDEEDRAERARQAEQDRKDREARIAAEATEKAAREAQERIEAAEREAREANERAEQAAEAERNRIAADKAREDESQRKRAENQRHRRTINQKIVTTLVASANLTEEQAKSVVILIASGLVPNVTLTY